MARKIITVDGLAGTGKTSLAKALAEKLGYRYFSSGSLYRALAWLALENDSDLSNGAELIGLLNSHKLSVEPDASPFGSQVLVDGFPRESLLHTPEVSEATSKIAVLAEVRERLLDLQREALFEYNLVAEGRDMGTIVFPEADLKFFLTASEEIRLQRRFLQLGGQNEKNEALKLKNELNREVSLRDRRDSERALAPTKPAPDAILLDNSHQTLTQTLVNMYDFALKKGLTSQ
ncbi:MAG: (d)CMP kinase [Bdellovibrionales bacterium]|nr:(d)CMP kinase [Bdellovibrionales bacterium]